MDGLDVHRVGGRYTYVTHAPAYVRAEFQELAFDLLVEDLNKAPLFSPAWSRWPVVRCCCRSPPN